MSFLPHQIRKRRSGNVAAQAVPSTEPGLDGDAVYCLAEVARLLPRGKGNQPVHVSAILRWISKGLQTPAGTIHLEATRAGGHWMVSATALRRFIDRLTRARQPEQPAASAVPDRRLTRADLVEAGLQELGL